MKTLLPLSLALLALSGGMVACTPAENTTPKPTQEIVTPPAESTDGKVSVDEEKTDDQLQQELADMATQTDLHLISQELDKVLAEKPGDDFVEIAEKKLSAYDYNPGTEINFVAREGNSEYTIKGWNADGWKFTSKEKALIFNSETGFKNAWAVPPKR